MKLIQQEKKWIGSRIFDPDIRYMIRKESLKIFMGYNDYSITNDGNKGLYKLVSDLERIIQSKLDASTS